MLLKWDKSNTYEYFFDIGNFKFKICTHKKNFKQLTEKKIIKNKNLPDLDITIWLDENDEYIRNIKKIMDKCEKYIPEAVVNSYKYLNLDLKLLENRINKYVKYNNDIYVHFRFPTENFYLVYSIDKPEIFIIGNEIYLERIITDLLTITSENLFLHAACIRYKEYGYIILGKSNYGKTGIALNMLENNAVYLADDIVQLNGNIANRCCDYMSVREEYIPDSLKKYVCYEKPNKSYIDLDYMREDSKLKISDIILISKIILISPMNKEELKPTDLFFIFSRDSMWCMDILKNYLPRIEKIMDHSTTYFNKLIHNIDTEILKIDYSNYKKSIYDFFNNINNRGVDLNER